MAAIGDVAAIEALRHSHKAENVQRHEGQTEADDPAPEGPSAPLFLETKAERLWEPVLIAGEIAEQCAGDQQVVEMRHSECGVVDASRYHREQKARDTAYEERDDKPERKKHRHREFYLAPIDRGATQIRL